MPFQVKRGAHGSSMSVRSLSVSFFIEKELIAAKNETKEKRWKEEEETLNSTCEQASKHPCLRVNEATAA
jgi:hypothetical protein